jgi:hypothetical protein
LSDCLQIRDDKQINILYDNHYLINHDLEINHLLIQTKEGLKETDKITFRELLKNEEIMVVARIDDSVLINDRQCFLEEIKKR